MGGFPCYFSCLLRICSLRTGARANHKTPHPKCVRQRGSSIVGGTARERTGRSEGLSGSKIVQRPCSYGKTGESRAVPAIQHEEHALRPFSSLTVAVFRPHLGASSCPRPFTGVFTEMTCMGIPPSTPTRLTDELVRVRVYMRVPSACFPRDVGRGKMRKWKLARVVLRQRRLHLETRSAPDQHTFSKLLGKVFVTMVINKMVGTHQSNRKLQPQQSGPQREELRQSLVHEHTQKPHSKWLGQQFARQDEDETTSGLAFRAIFIWYRSVAPDIVHTTKHR